jgi:hypothetical protein
MYAQRSQAFSAYHVQTTHVNGKMIPVETIPGMGGKGVKKNDRGGEFKYDIF